MLKHSILISVLKTEVQIVCIGLCAFESIAVQSPGLFNNSCFACMIHLAEFTNNVGPPIRLSQTWSFGVGFGMRYRWRLMHAS